MLIKEWRCFLLAVGFFTRIPVPQHTEFDEGALNSAAKYFPLVGVLVGLIGAGAYLLGADLLPHSLAILISMATTICLTGAFHEDGLADSADGIGGGWHTEQILAIMQDSRLGVYGVLVLCLAVLTKFQLLYLLNGGWVALALVAAHAISRLSAIWLMATLSYAKQSGKAKPMATGITRRGLLLANLFGLLPMVITLLLISHYPWQAMFQFVWMTCLPVVLSWLWWRRKINRWLGGYTGDALGAMQQIAELAFYFGLVLWSMHH